MTKKKGARGLGIQGGMLETDRAETEEKVTERERGLRDVVDDSTGTIRRDGKKSRLEREEMTNEMQEKMVIAVGGARQTEYKTSVVYWNVSLKAPQRNTRCSVTMCRCQPASWLLSLRRTSLRDTTGSLSTSKVTSW